jgi:hypothetical protein
VRISVDSKGEFKKLQSFLKKASKGDFFSSLEELAKQGKTALEHATPVDSEETASSWSYKVKNSKRTCSIEWYNDHTTEDGDPIIILLQYGHGTGTGGWVEGRDFINPAIQPVMNKIADKVWKAVKSA